MDKNRSVNIFLKIFWIIPRGEPPLFKHSKPFSKDFLSAEAAILQFGSFILATV